MIDIICRFVFLLILAPRIGLEQFIRHLWKGSARQVKRIENIFRFIKLSSSKLFTNKSPNFGFVFINFGSVCDKRPNNVHQRPQSVLQTKVFVCRTRVNHILFSKSNQFRFVSLLFLSQSTVNVERVDERRPWKSEKDRRTSKLFTLTSNFNVDMSKR
jgi:hypothetical protein